MTATPADYIAATGFSVRDDVLMGAFTLSLTASSTAVPSPPTLAAGQRFSVASGGNTDDYRVVAAVTGQLVTGVRVDWVDITIAPAAARAYTAGDPVTWQPYAQSKATIPTQETKVGQGHSIQLTDYFEMVGGRDADLSFIARPGGAAAKVAVSASVLTIAGVVAGSLTVTVTAFDKASGRVTQTFRINVGVENRAPVSDKALGNPTVGVGATVSYDLTDYFSDPDADLLSFTYSGEDAAIAAVTNPGAILTITGVAAGAFTLDVTATDQLLTTSQQMRVTVPPNRRPLRTSHVASVALALAGQPVTRDIAASFRDPDGGVLSWLVQWEEGDPAHQYRQEFWEVVSQTGTNLLALRSHFPYPVNTPPWGSGSAWLMPAGTPFVLRTARGTDPAIVRTTGTALSSATASWDATTRRVHLGLRTAAALDTAALAPPSRLLLGADPDVAWVEGDQRDVINFLPGGAPGGRTAYVKVWDAGGLFASDLFNVALGRAPVATAIAAVTVFTGGDAVIALDDHFTDPDGDALTYSVAASAPNIVAASVVPRQVVTAGSISVASDLHVHGLTVGAVTLTIAASDGIGLTETGALAASVILSVVFDASLVADMVRRFGTRFYFTAPTGD